MFSTAHDPCGVKIFSVLFLFFLIDKSCACICRILQCCVGMCNDRYKELSPHLCCDNVLQHEKTETMMITTRRLRWLEFSLYYRAHLQNNLAVLLCRFRRLNDEFRCPIKHCNLQCMHSLYYCNTVRYPCIQTFWHVLSYRVN